MNNEMKNEEAVSPVIATILMVAITVVLAGVLYVWASSLAGDSTGDTLDTYVWSAVDASPGDTNSSKNDLIRVQMDGGQELNWGVVEITITVNGATPQSCGGKATDVDGAGCYFTKYQGSGDTDEWSTGEGITISEGTDDICDGSVACNVAVSIVKKGAGNADDKVIGTVSALSLIHI